MEKDRVKGLGWRGVWGWMFWSLRDNARLP